MHFDNFQKLIDGIDITCAKDQNYDDINGDLGNFDLYVYFLK